MLLWESVRRNVMVPHRNGTRRNFLKSTVGAAMGVVGLPYVVRSTALGGSR